MTEEGSGHVVGPDWPLMMAQFQAPLSHLHWLPLSALQLGSAVPPIEQHTCPGSAQVTPERNCAGLAGQWASERAPDDWLLHAISAMHVITREQRTRIVDPLHYRRQSCA